MISVNKSKIASLLLFGLVLICYKSNGQVWNQIGQNIYGSAPGNKAGTSIDINTDGTVMAIGEPLHDDGGNLIGRVSVYSLQSGSWVLKGSILTSSINEEMYGNAVSLSADGNTLAVGAKLNDDNGDNAGKVIIYQYIGTDWVQFGNILLGANPGDVFGASVELDASGLRLAIGMIGDDTNGDSSGKVQVYQYNTGIWSALGSPMIGLSHYNGLGASLQLSGDGSTLIASAGYFSYDEISKGYICVFRYNGNDWQQISPILWGDNYGDLFGNAVAISGNGNTIIVGAPFCNSSFGVDAGAVKVLDYDGTDWTQRGPTFLGNIEGGQKGKSVTISDDGNTIAISEPNNNTNGFMSGKVSVYQWSGSNWMLKGAEFDGALPFDCTGSRICICGTGENLIIGIPGDDSTGNDSGKVQLYKFY